MAPSEFFSLLIFWVTWMVVVADEGFGLRPVRREVRGRLCSTTTDRSFVRR